MIINEITASLPDYLYFSVLAAVLVYLIWAAVMLIRLSVRTMKIRRELNEIETEIALQQGCLIENLPLISTVFESASGKLSDSFRNLMQGAADYYHKRWIPDPSGYIDITSLTDKSLRSGLKRTFFLRYLAAGLTLTFISLAAGAYTSDTPDSLKYVLWISALPFFITMITSVTVYINTVYNSSSIENSISSMNKVISLKIPVFSENAGVSLLVSQFIEYDRSMSGSVEDLAKKIDRFTSDGLVSAVSSSIEDTLREAVFPSIERTNDAILALADDIASREDEGMKALAVNFASSVTSELSYHLKPLTAQIENLSHTLADSKNYVDVISQNINIYKQNASELQALTRKTLIEYEESRKSFSADISSIADSLKEQSEISKQYKENVSVDVTKFQASVDSLNNKLTESDKTLKVMLDAIFVEARNAEDNALKAQNNAKDYLESMKEQITGLTAELAARNNTLISDLDRTMKSFFDKQNELLESNNSGLSERTAQLLASMESSAETIRESTSQIKAGFDELEEVRRREEEAKAKKSIFKRNK